MVKLSPNKFPHQPLMFMENPPFIVDFPSPKNHEKPPFRVDVPSSKPQNLW
jgi:hypothetical protein